MKINSVPYALDFTLVRAGAISREQAALTLRYGNSEVALEKPEIIEKAIVFNSKGDMDYQVVYIYD